MREQEVRELYEAYMQVHQSQEEVEQLDENVQGAVAGALKKGADFMKTNPVGKAVSSVIAPVGKGKGTVTASQQKQTISQNEEFEQVDEDANYDRNRRRAAQRAAARNEARRQGKTGSVPGVGYVSPRPERETYRDSAGVERHTSGARMPKREDQKESYDLFDVILEHLIAEGYADTNEAALAIMANMSEEWRESIVEELEQLAEISQKTATRAYAASSTGEFEGMDSPRDVKRTDRLRGHIERKFGKKAAKHADRAAHSMTFGRKGAGGMGPKP
jgi:hypothetical protein